MLGARIIRKNNSCLKVAHSSVLKVDYLMKLLNTSLPLSNWTFGKTLKESLKGWAETPYLANHIAIRQSVL